MQVTATAAVKPLWLFIYRKGKTQNVFMRRWLILDTTVTVTKIKVLYYLFANYNIYGLPYESKDSPLSFAAEVFFFFSMHTVVSEGRLPPNFPISYEVSVIWLEN